MTGIEIFYAVIIIALMAVALILTPSPKSPQGEDKKLEIPTVEEGKFIGVVYGTVQVRDPSVADYWGLNIVVESKGGGKKQ